MVDDIFEIILDILGEVLTFIKRKDKDMKNINVNNSDNLRHSNKINFFNKKMDYYKKHENGSLDYSEKTKIITEIVGVDIKRGILGYTENGTGKLIEIKISKNLY
ncbi:hypothetical protein [Clostridium sp. CF012]|uniref:hypothetical protein n=1 Tax=Clostridium sp. CF012 TaxID=2843319 RepID=UPI001C0C67A1|nr:hypothetical protein [Clostridium sp. CF012]MBU3143891.1 hypothetical protein [Clostridium sp. CF012]